MKTRSKACIYIPAITAILLATSMFIRCAFVFTARMNNTIKMNMAYMKIRKQGHCSIEIDQWENEIHCKMYGSKIILTSGGGDGVSSTNENDVERIIKEERETECLRYNEDMISIDGTVFLRCTK